jgi:predicted NAD/FAD-binding protein
MIDFPLRFFVQFFKNHGLLSVNNRPQWRVIKGGSRSYLDPLTDGFSKSIMLNANIDRVRRLGEMVELIMADGRVLTYDHVVLACHSDQALSLLGDASLAERLLPRRRVAWSSWNYLLRDRFQERAILTYNMNILQGIKSDSTFCVTLNATDSINPAKIIDRFNYSHPVFSLDSVQAASRIDDINGNNNTWFAGAWLGNGFHEDGVVSGRKVADSINRLAVVPAATDDLMPEPEFVRA